jgi:nitroimidazol reductase NimA-like FMN-containing flavoprotein (pyridoxamine 5'-phosphate oxidase superfamily)
MDPPSSRIHPFTGLYKGPGFIENGAVRSGRDADIRTLIRRLLSAQKLGVLATREARAPYQSLVAFAASEDLRSVYFATATHTRKYGNLIRSPQVSMLIDNRDDGSADFDKGIAVSALGRAIEVKERSRRDVVDVYLKKHPALDGFIKSPPCRLFRIKVKTYVVVTEFERVRTYHPAP